MSDRSIFVDRGRGSRWQEAAILFSMVIRGERLGKWSFWWLGGEGATGGLLCSSFIVLQGSFDEDSTEICRAWKLGGDRPGSVASQRTEAAVRSGRVAGFIFKYIIYIPPSATSGFSDSATDLAWCG
ncbi:hypothetical protein J5N97_020686 [Dioscorea zingiberensis]|uniref:Uncharacterized protein n=1 Tax=Dioscorea zingiberensis TaxID=325984 RepID=A0A9D5CG95_9LILI|nr:hypothetical protein J5N97_020686 [Dioscorea zingiberensis]